MKKFFKSIDHFFEGLTFLSVTAMILVVLLQVFARFALPKAPSWTEELSRILFICSVAFAAPIAMKKGEFVKVDTLISILPRKVAKILEVVVDAVICAFICMVAYYAVDFVKLGSIQSSPSMGVPMAIPFSAMFIAPLFIGLYGLKKIIEGAVDLKK
ncbi:TRAP transporter small permease [Marinisporobacter balticus]|uniref:TRAP transporter small permease n=1 Tax=Marinisporobacter balticus TaxID=2018667 RepID=UPI0014053598|nr:TRAP transporter small permease [Marinisporobacter balticus]